MIWFAIGLLYLNAIADWLLMRKIHSILDLHNKMFQETLDILKLTEQQKISK